MFDILKDILRDNRFTPVGVADLEGKLFFDGDRRRPYLVRYTVLLFLSTIIATFGILQDSTATVIGAMLVAPLMTPMVAIAAALVMGRPKKASRSALIVLAGILLVIGVSLLIGLLTITVISVKSNSQIAARISPNLEDLAVALAAGAAGAFAYSRDDIADSLPGVAIAIALVPPLSVVGITLSQGNWLASSGAMLLFVTNLLSILVAGGLVFGLLNLSGASVRDKDFSEEARRRVYRYIVFGTLLVSIPLALATYQVTRDSIWQRRVNDVVRVWLTESGNVLELEKVTVSSSELTILLSGEEQPHSVDELENALYELNDKFGDAILRVNYEGTIPLTLEPPAD